MLFLRKPLSFAVMCLRDDASLCVYVPHCCSVRELIVHVYMSPECFKIISMKFVTRKIHT